MTQEQFENQELLSDQRWCVDKGEIFTGEQMIGVIANLGAGIQPYEAYQRLIHFNVGDNIEVTFGDGSNTNIVRVR